MPSASKASFSLPTYSVVQPCSVFNRSWFARMWSCLYSFYSQWVQSGQPPHLGFDISRRILHDYGEKTLNQQSINAAGPSKEHIEAQPIGGRTDQYATQKNRMSPPRLLILDSEYTHVIRAVCAKEYRNPVVVTDAIRAVCAGEY